LRSPPRILAVDDVPTNLEILKVRLESQGYEVVTAADGEEALLRARELEPDLVLLDVMMPKLDGISVLKQLKLEAAQKFVPVILVTAKADTRDIVNGLEAGGDDYLTKPFEQAALLARVRSLLRTKDLHDTVQQQALKLKEQTEQLSSWNQTLEERVAAQLAEIDRIGRLQRFLAPQVAQMIASSDSPESALASHRREVTVVFCDLRGFTAFTETSEPEEVMGVLHDYHEGLGELIFRHEGTLDRFAGDGIMIVFNDPIAYADHTERAVRLALDMRDQVEKLSQQWQRRGHTLGFGVGIAAGYATLGQIGFEQRREYTAIGSVINLASRLCDEARPGQIIIGQRAFSAVEQNVEAQSIGELSLKGFAKPVAAHAIIRWRDQPASQTPPATNATAGGRGSRS
jgi:class 3 adenylate cyclase/CheY-like chemotaxis protein